MPQVPEQLRLNVEDVTGKTIEEMWKLFAEAALVPNTLRPGIVENAQYRIGHKLFFSGAALMFYNLLQQAALPDTPEQEAIFQDWLAKIHNEVEASGYANFDGVTKQ